MLKHLRNTLASFFVLFMVLSLNVVSLHVHSSDLNVTDIETKEETPPSKDKLSNLYSPHFLRLIQISFGSEAIISQGGLHSVDYLFKEINLDGKRMLDVGCGFGGVDIYLAQQYSCQIIGVDCEPYMIMQAQKYLEEESRLFLGQVKFQVSKELTTLKEFPSHSFDVVCCKETLYHVPKNQKQQYLSEMYRVLKPGGILLIADWCQGTPLPGENLKRTIGIEGFCHYVTPTELLQNIMAEANFKKVTFEDVTFHHIQYTKEDIARIQWATNQIEQELGEGATNRALKSRNLWLTALETHELVAGIFIGHKAD